MGLYGSGAIMCGPRMVPIEANAVIPNEWIYKMAGSKRRARKMGNLRIGITPISRDIYIDSWWREIRGAEYCLIGPLKWVAWGGHWHQVKGCLLAICYWQEGYSIASKRSIGQWVISFIGVTRADLVESLLVVPSGWSNELQE
jgi:hypothetical protein